MRSRGGGCRAASERIDAREQFLHRERLREIIVRAGLQPLDAARHIAARREDEHARKTALFFQLREHIEAVHAGQIQIEHDEVRLLRERRAQALRAIMHRARLVAGAHERTGDVAGELEFVFDDEDAHGEGG